MGNENTHVANATQEEISIYFQSTAIHLNDIAFGANVEADAIDQSIKAGVDVKINLKPDTRVQFLRVPPRGVINIPEQGDIYITVVANDVLLAMNFRIPSDRSVIVADRTVIFAVYGTIWKGENGTNY